MMKNNYLRPVGIECIIPEVFPDIDLFLKSSENYVLYRNHDRKFTVEDKTRLLRSNVEFLFVRSGDMQVLSEYLENSLDSLLKSDASSRVKGKVLYQISANYVHDIFETPESAADVKRCKSLIKNMLQYISTEKNALESFKDIVSHNFYIFVHSVQVAALSLLINFELYLPDRDELIDVGVGSILHDFGMIYVSNDILEKPDALSSVEYYRYKQHTTKGYEFLKELGTFGDIPLNIVRHHHEKVDGSGYPLGLKGEAMSRSVHIAAMCDVYCTLMSERGKKRGLTSEEALKAMKGDKMKGAFDERLLQRFEEVIAVRPG